MLETVKDCNPYFIIFSVVIYMVPNREVARIVMLEDEDSNTLRRKEEPLSALQLNIFPDLLQEPLPFPK